MKENPISFPFLRIRASELPRASLSHWISDLFSIEIPMQISFSASQGFDPLCDEFYLSNGWKMQLSDMPRSPLESVVVTNVPKCNHWFFSSFENLEEPLGQPHYHQWSLLRSLGRERKWMKFNWICVNPSHCLKSGSSTKPLIVGYVVTFLFFLKTGIWNLPPNTNMHEKAQLAEGYGYTGAEGI